MLAGGIESMSRMPYFVDSEDARWGHKMGNFTLVDAMFRDGFMCPISNLLMGQTAEVLARQARTLDAARPEAVARRRKTGQRTTRENIEDLLDPGTFQEYGALVVAARRRRHSLEELTDQTSADGMVMGLGQVNGALFPEEKSRVAVMAYDYTVLAGTQGGHNHDKLDRMSELALRWRLPGVGPGPTYRLIIFKH